MKDALDAILLAESDPPSKREILRSALRLFVRDGVCETSIRAIGEASGYTNPALYRFFESKDALALHLFERCYLRLFSAIEASQQPGRDFDANLDALVGAYGQLVDDSLDAVLYVNETLRLFWPKLPRGARKHSLIREVRALVEQGIAEGAIDAGTDVDLAVGMLLGTMTQLARMAYFGEVSRPTATRAAALCDLFRQALTRRTR